MPQGYYTTPSGAPLSKQNNVSSLSELYSKISGKLGFNVPPGPDASKLVWNNPLDAITGAIGAIPGMVSSLGESFVKAATAFLPQSTIKYLQDNPLPEDNRSVPGFLDVTPWLNKITNNVAQSIPRTGGSFNERAERVAGAATLGMSDAFHQQSLNTLLSEGEAKTPTETFSRFLSSVAGFIGRDLLPGKELQENLTGKEILGVNALGQTETKDIDAKRVGENLVTGTLKTLMAGGIFSNLRSVGRGILKSQGMTAPELTPNQIARDPGYAEMHPYLTSEDRILYQERPSIGELNKAKESLAATPSEMGISQAAQRSPIIQEALKAGWDTESIKRIQDQAAENLGTNVILSDPFVRRALTDVVNTDIFRQITTQGFEQAKKTGTVPPWSQNVSDAILQGAVKPATLIDFAKEHNLSLDDMPALTKTYAAAILNTASKAGGSVGIHGQAAYVYYYDMLDRANKGEYAAQRWIRAQESAKRAIKSKEWGLSNTVAGWLRNSEARRITGMTALPWTAERNFIVQAGLTTPLAFFEESLAHTNAAIRGESLPQKAGNYASDIFWNTLHTWTEAVPAQIIADNPGITSTNWFEAQPRIKLSFDPLKLQNAILDLSPAGRFDIENKYAYDLNMQVLKDYLQYKKTNGAEGALPQGPMANLDLVLETFSVPNRLQEVFNRKMQAIGILDSNLKAVGINDIWEMDDTGKPKLIKSRMDQHAEIMNDPEHPNHSLHKILQNDAEHESAKGTFAWSPRTGLAKGILDVYKAIPGLTLIAPEFPRFAINSLRYFTEHNPFGMLNLMDPQFREQLNSDAGQGFASHLAQRRLAKAVTGTLMFGAAYHLRSNPDTAGPKYYQIKDPTTGKDSYEDFRALNPFNLYLAIADELVRSSKGLPSNLDTGDMADLAFNIRRTSDYAGLAVGDWLRDIDAKDPDAFRNDLASPAGRYFATWLTLSDIPKTGMQIVGKLTNTPWLANEGIRRDTTGDKFVGQIAERIPGLSQTLPARIDPTTGKPIEQEELFWKSFGLTHQVVNDLKQKLSSVGIEDYQITGRQPSPEATRLVAKHMGTLFQTPDSTGTPSYDGVFRDIFNSNYDTITKNFYITERLNLIRDMAVEAAKREKPSLFIDSFKPADLPPAHQIPIERLIKQALENSR